MHLSTRSARLSRFMPALPFSVLIQHSEAAPERVIGGSGAFAGSAGLAGELSAAKGPGVLPSVSQPASSAAAARISASRGKTLDLLRDFKSVIVGDPGGDVIACGRPLSTVLA